MSDDHNTRKPHNYWEEATPAQREEWAKQMQREAEESARLEAAAAEANRMEEIANNQRTFDPDYLERFKFIGNDGNGDSKKKQQQESKPSVEVVKISPEIDLDPHIPDRDYAEYYINVVKKTVRREDSFVRQVFYTALSKDSDDPLNLAVLAKTSAGKTYGITETLKYFKDKSIWYIGSISPKVIVRQNGLLVDSNYQPLKPQLKELEKQLKEAEKKKDTGEVEELEEELEQLKENAKVLIELEGLCLVFLEPPHSETWNILKSTLSHDKYEIEHPYVYDVPGMGFKVKKIVTRGWPSCIFASARDESEWKIWPEIQSRFLVISPNIIPEKVREGNILISQRKSLPRRIKEKIIVSSQEEDIAYKCARYLMQHVKSNMVQQPDKQKDPFWIPYGLIIGLALPSEKGTDNRVTSRIFSFLRMIALVRSHLRFRLRYYDENLIVPMLADLHETFHIMQNISGIPDYKLAMFKDYYWPCYQSKFQENQGVPDMSSDGKKVESVLGLSNKYFCDYYKKQTDKILSTKSFRETYVEEWYNNGLVEVVDSVVNAKQHIHYPILMEPKTESQGNNTNIPPEDGNGEAYDIQAVFKIDSLGVSTKSPIDLQPKPIVVQKNFKEIPENWLELQYLGFLRLTFQDGKTSGELSSLSDVFDVCQLYDERDSKICICQFIDRYTSAHPLYSLNAYFQNGISSNKYKETEASIRNPVPHEPKDCKTIGDWLQTP